MLLTETQEDQESDQESDQSETDHVFTGNIIQSQQTILATAIVPVKRCDGQLVRLRALIDQGSMANILSERAHQLLNTKKTKESIPLISIGDTRTGYVNFSTKLKIGSLYDDTYQVQIKALILPKITHVKPTHKGAYKTWQHIDGLQLADINHMHEGPIDLLLGAQVLAEILLPGLKKGSSEAPIAQQTKLGWILSGGWDEEATTHRVQCNFTHAEMTELSEAIKKFWIIEEAEYKPLYTPEEQNAERKFVETLVRGTDGKFIIELPFNEDPTNQNFLGNSYRSALSRFLQVERKLYKSPDQLKQYKQCINEYLELDHMRLATNDEIKDDKAYFLPHHAVLKETSETTKLRIVFDASCKSTNGYSLNDRLLVGPTIQNDLFSLIINWRKLEIAFCGDIEKMYRQVWINKEHIRFQRILWRNHKEEEINQYLLKTVTFGTASAPFQAIRTLFQIASDIENELPDIAKLIRENFYVDDFMGGAETLNEAKMIQVNMSETLKKYGFHLRKWKTNSEQLSKIINQENKALPSLETCCKALGILWQPNTDEFTFQFNLEPAQPPLSKRQIFSEIAKLFDPLGWISPSIIQAKILMQSLWMQSLSWDENVSTESETQWLTIRAQLLECHTIRINRWLHYSKNQSCAIHGFSDASEKAYAAVIYLRVEKPDGSIKVNIITAKTRVAPLKKISIARLELCAALLLSKLIVKVAQALNFSEIPIFAWTDSTIVLSWLCEHPVRWKTFVANRVSEIQDNVSPDRWQHIPTKLNPADIASRGMTFNELRDSSLWWHGPPFLSNSMDQWPRKTSVRIKTALPETRKKMKLFYCNPWLQKESLISKFSSLNKLLRVTAYCLRWSKHRRTQEVVITASELDYTLKIWIKLTQEEYYPMEMQRLRQNRPLPSHSSILALDPYLDDNAILRVGGRLQEAHLTHDMKHPIILPPSGHLTWLITYNAHNQTFHGGVQLTLQFLRQRYWIVHGRSTVKKQLHRCTICFRFRKQTAIQKMGNLPSIRLQQSRPFAYTGIDFAGFFECKESIRKNARYTKCYISLFICLATKAIHLELVHNLTSEAFLGALKRFIARRGIPNQIYSDRGTNFVGANNELPKLLFDRNSQQSQEILTNIATNGIQWKFIPAHAPHIGGIWEAGVKSTKYHLKRVLKDTKLTFEDFCTLITQIEACLNSRPLCPITAEITDLSVLTPGHFLIGQAINTLPEPNLDHIASNRLTHYQLLTRLYNDFWKKWSIEYLSQLQHRPKWQQTKANLEVGQIVIIKEDNLPPAQWLLGRIVNVFPGKDKLVRVVEVQCKGSVLRRPIHKLCLLPTIDNIPERTA